MSKYLSLCEKLRKMELFDFYGLEINYEEYDNVLKEIRGLEKELGIDKPFEGAVFLYD